MIYIAVLGVIGVACCICTYNFDYKEGKNILKYKTKLDKIEKEEVEIEYIDGIESDPNTYVNVAINQ
jgi:hypothetical protein